MPDVTGFLSAYPPFDALGPDELARLAEVTGTEFTASGKTIFSQGAGPVDSVRMVRDGSVEIIHDGRMLDLLGPGELFGHASMISGLPTGFEARAGQDTTCYRIPADVMRPLLARPDVLRFVARSIVAGPAPSVPPEDPAEHRVASLIRTPPLVCDGSEPIREAAKRMTAEGASAVLVRTGAGAGDEAGAAVRLGIVTDRDLRSRVVAAGLSPDAPLAAIMTEPAYTVSSDRLAGDVMLDMLERDIHHIPVLSPAGAVLGVVDDGDLVAAEARKPLLLRRAIDLAASAADLVAASAGLGPMIIAMHDGQVAAEQVAAVHSVVLDALARKLVGLAVREAGPPPAALTWFALGSLARREAVPSSDVDSALAWSDEAGADQGSRGMRDPEMREYAARLGRAVDEGLRECGLQPDAHGASAASPLFARSLASWRAATRSLSQDPAQEQALILVSVITDSRPVWSTGPGGADGLWDTGTTPPPGLLRLLARFALSFRPPTGFLRDFVVEHSGERRGQLDLKAGGLTPIADLARWAAMTAGVASASTMARLRVAEAAGTLDSAQARALMEAFGFISSLRLDHQVEQLRSGAAPDNFIDPRTLNPLARSYLRDAFRAVASVQSGLANELAMGIR